MSKQYRRVKQIAEGAYTQDGAGVKLKRILARRHVKEYDPFLMFDFFDTSNSDDYIKGFPWHPHRGIETITYLISGEITHEDSMGNKGTIGAGDAQWMNGGSGIMHQEMPQKSDYMLGFQLWLNLPQKDKMSKPAYHDIVAATIPVVRQDGAEIRVISGEYGGEKGFSPDFVQARLLDLSLEGGTSIEIEAKQDAALFLFSLSGDFMLGEAHVPEKEAALTTFGDTLLITAGEKDVRMLIAMGEMLLEPIAWAGPIVMNTEEELEVAFDELENGSFIKDEHASFDSTGRA